VKPIEEIAQSIVDEMDITDLMAMAIVDTEAWLKDMGADGELQETIEDRHWKKACPIEALKGELEEDLNEIFEDYSLKCQSIGYTHGVTTQMRTDSENMASDHRELQKHIFWITYPHIVCNPKMYHL
jgi:hypothetical protein